MARLFEIYLRAQGPFRCARGRCTRREEMSCISYTKYTYHINVTQNCPECYSPSQEGLPSYVFTFYSTSLCVYRDVTSRAQKCRKHQIYTKFTLGCISNVSNLTTMPSGFIFLRVHMFGLWHRTIYVICIYTFMYNVHYNFLCHFKFYCYANLGVFVSHTTIFFLLLFSYIFILF